MINFKFKETYYNLLIYYFLVEGKFSKMLHEILFALLGHTGSIIIELPLIEQQVEFAKQMMLD